MSYEVVKSSGQRPQNYVLVGSGAHCEGSDDDSVIKEQPTDDDSALHSHHARL